VSSLNVPRALRDHARARRSGSSGAPSLATAGASPPGDGRPLERDEEQAVHQEPQEPITIMPRRTTSVLYHCTASIVT
jgi:hypothetical protein